MTDMLSIEIRLSQGLGRKNAVIFMTYIVEKSEFVVKIRPQLSLLRVLLVVFCSTIVYDI